MFEIKVNEVNFTFHNVSINTILALDFSASRINFTFHNVSINTAGIVPDYDRYITLHSTMFLLILLKSITTSTAAKFLYIPQCFY